MKERYKRLQQRIFSCKIDCSSNYLTGNKSTSLCLSASPLTTRRSVRSDLPSYSAFILIMPINSLIADEMCDDGTWALLFRALLLQDLRPSSATLPLSSRRFFWGGGKLSDASALCSAGLHAVCFAACALVVFSSYHFQVRLGNWATAEQRKHSKAFLDARPSESAENLSKTVALWASPDLNTLIMNS